jgi:hypothetical protein
MTWRLPDPILERRVLLALVAVMALVYVAGILVTTGTRRSLVQGDARSYFAYLPSLVLDGDVDLRNQFLVLQPEGNSQYPFGIGRNRLARNPFPIAPAVLWLPGYLTGLAIDATVGTEAATGQRLGYGVGAVLGTAVWSILIVGIGAELTRRLVQHAVGSNVAFLATLMAWLATPALYYTVISPLYSHALAWVAVSVMLWLTWRAAHQQQLGLWIAAGFAAGWVVAIRLQDAPLLIIVATMLIVTLRRRQSFHRAPVLALALTGAIAAGYLIQAITWYWLTGAWVPLGGVRVLVAPRLSELYEILFSVGYRGWISWTPIVLPALAGLGVLAGRGAAVTRALAVSGMAAVAGILMLDVMHPFGAGAAFGARRYVSVTPLLALGLAVWLGNIVGPRVRAAAWIGLSVLTAWNLCVLLSYELLIIRHGVYPTLLQVVRHAAGLGIP